MSARTDAWFYFRAKDAGLSSGLNRMGNNVDRFSKRSKRNVRDLGLELGRLNSRMMSLGRNLPGVGLLSGAGMFYGAKKAIDEFAERESIQVAIEYISGNQEEAARNLGFLKSVTNEMGLAYNATAEGFKVFTGSMIGGKYTMEEQRSMFTKISTAVRVLGLDAQRTESIFRAFSEMLSKGKMQAQELRVQLANALPGTMSLLATSMGKTRAEVEKMLSAGEITTDKYFAGFLNALYERYEPGLERAKKKTVAKLARISNSWDSAWVNMGDAIAQSGVLSHIGNILKSTDLWIQSNKELIGQNVKGVVDALVGGLGFVKDNWQDIKSGFAGIAAGFALLKGIEVVKTLTSPLGLAATSVSIIATGIGIAVDEIQSLKKMSKELSAESDKQKELNMKLSPTANIVHGLGNMLGGLIPIPGLAAEGWKSGAYQLGAGAYQVSQGFLQSGYELGGVLGVDYMGSRADYYGRKGMDIERGLFPSKYKDDAERIEGSDIVNFGDDSKIDSKTISDSVFNGIVKGFSSMNMNYQFTGVSNNQEPPASGVDIKFKSTQDD